VRRLVGVRLLPAAVQTAVIATPAMTVMPMMIPIHMLIRMKCL
jgi:hypothetical protein